MMVVSQFFLKKNENYQKIQIRKKGDVYIFF